MRSILLCLCLISCALPKGRTIVEQYQTAVAIVVRCESGIHTGSGSLLRGDYVVTARHVVQCSAGQPLQMMVITREAPLEVKTVRSDAGADIAWITLQQPTKEPVPEATAAQPPPAGGTVCTVTTLPTQRRVCGEVFHDFESHTRTRNFGAAIEPGNSGSAVYDIRGRLIGVISLYGTCGNGTAETLCVSRIALVP